MAWRHASMRPSHVLPAIVSCYLDGECGALGSLLGADEESAARFASRVLKRAKVRVAGGYVLLHYGENRGFLENPVYAMMRGHVVDRSAGVLVASPFYKFFNYGENSEAHPPGDTERAVFTEKLDGTLIIVWRGLDGELHANTRGMLETMAPADAHYYVSRYPEYVGRGVRNPFVIAFYEALRRLGEDGVLGLVREGETWMFELVPPVPASRLAAGGRRLYEAIFSERTVPYLLAVRGRDGRLRLPGVDFDPGYQLVPSTYDVRDINDALALVSGWKDREGLVVYYPGHYYAGHGWWELLLKVKSPQYVLRGTAAGHVNYRKLVHLTLSSRADDIVPLLDPETRADFQVIAEYMYRIVDVVGRLRELYAVEPEKTYNIIAYTYRMRDLADALAAGRHPKNIATMLASKCGKTRKHVMKCLLRLLDRLERLAAETAERRGKEHTLV